MVAVLLIFATLCRAKSIPLVVCARSAKILFLTQTSKKNAFLVRPTWYNGGRKTREATKEMTKIARKRFRALKSKRVGGTVLLAVREYWLRNVAIEWGSHVTIYDLEA